MPKIIVDFETYYDKSLSVLIQGLRNYVKKSDAYIVAVVTPQWKFCGPPQDLPRLHGDSWMTDPSNEFWAANSNFDQAFWEKYFPKTARDWSCALDLAAFHQLPRDLAGVSRVALQKIMDKTTRDEMKGVDFHTLTPERQQQVIDYCLNDALVTEEIINTLPPMSPKEAELAAHTRLLNRRGIRVDVERIKRDCGLLGELHHLAFHKIPWTEADEAPLSYQQFAIFCESQGVAPPKSLDKRDLACTAWMEVNPELAKILTAMRTYRGVNTKLEKLKSILAAADKTDVIPLDFLYCGARHTRRWSSKNINVQNLDAKRVFEDEMAELPFFQENPDQEPGIFMREYFLPPPGKKFGIADYSQIEPRVLNWIVGNEEMLGAIRQGFGIYEAHARASMGWKGDAGTLKQTDPARYKFAKERVLSLGYGMGWVKFQARAKTNLNVDLTNVQAVREVNNFRLTNPRITAQWRQFGALIKAAAYEQDKLLEITMPTGDTLKHFHVQGKGFGNGFKSYTIRGEFSQMSVIENLFGGLLTENVTQRMSRDILAEAILRLEESGIPIAFHSHDEAITLLDAEHAKEEFEEAKSIMSQVPEWAPGLPIEVAGEITDTYTKLQ